MLGRNHFTERNQHVQIFFIQFFFFGPHILSTGGTALSYMFSTKGWSTQKDKSWRNLTMLKANIHQDFYWGKNILDCSKTCFPIFFQLLFGKIVKTHHKKTLWQLPPSKGYELISVFCA
jgi:hypothetical protein